MDLILHAKFPDLLRYDLNKKLEENYKKYMKEIENK